MPLLISCVAVIAIAVLFRSSIRRYAPFYYAASLALVVLYLVGVAGMLPAWLEGGVFLLMQKGTLPMAMFLSLCSSACFRAGRNLVFCWDPCVLSFR